MKFVRKATEVEAVLCTPETSKHFGYEKPVYLVTFINEGSHQKAIPQEEFERDFEPEGGWPKPRPKRERKALGSSPLKEEEEGA